MSAAGLRAFLAVVEARLAVEEAHLERLRAWVEEDVAYLSSLAVQRSTGGGDGRDARGPGSVSTDSETLESTSSELTRGEAEDH